MNIKEDLFKYKGFKLISLDLRDNKLMGKSKLYYNFIESNETQEKIYTTVLIGPNGTGKSNLFRIIIELFKELYDLSIDKPRSYNVDGRFNLKFSVNGDIYEYSNIILEENNSKDLQIASKKGNPPYLLKNGNVSDFVTAQFPIAIIANAIMLTDKFPIYNTESNFPIYKYLGVKNRPQQASTRSYVRNTVKNIVDQINNEGFVEGIKKIINFLGIDPSIEIIYHTVNAPIFFTGKLHPKIIEDFFEKIRKKYEDSKQIPPFKYDNYLKITDNNILKQELCDYCNHLYSEQRLKYIPNSSGKLIVFDIINSDSFTLLKKEYQLLEQLRKIGLLHPPEINLKRNSKYDLQDSSSGEYHFFSTIVGLMATVKINSLILIDEPEVSLHPNWQMKYLSFIRELFASPLYAESHILVATHSHFLISDLKGESSKIIGLKREADKIKIVDLPENINTYGWSAEEILYNIFNVKTVRNHFLEADLTDLLGLISENSKDKFQIEKLLNTIKSLKISSNDPLNAVIEEANEYLKTI